MARLRYNGLTAELGADLLTADTTITFTAALTSAAGAVPTITGSDYIPLVVLGASGGAREVVHLTAYTTGATTGTVTRAQESTTAADHDTGLTVVNGPTAADFTDSIYGRMRRTTDQAVATGGAVTKVAFDSETTDTGSCVDIANSRFVAPTAGTYAVTASISFSASLTDVQLYLYVNGAALDGSGLVYRGTSVNAANGAAALSLSAGDTVDFRTVSGGAYTIRGTLPSWATFARVG